MKRLQINIEVTTATELCQIEFSETDKATKKSTTHIKKQAVLATNSKGVESRVQIPIFSGNSFRAKLRRAALKILMDKSIEKGFNVSNPTDFHLMNAGGGAFQRQPYDIEDQVRELNPIISVFGTSLAVEGKIKTPNLIPYKYIDADAGEKEYYLGENKETGMLYSTIEFDDSFYKKDDMLDRSGNAKYLPKEMLVEWQQAVEENQTRVAKSRENDDGDKVKRESIRSALLRRYVIRGTHFYTGLSEMPTSQMNEIERGMLYRALEIVVLENLGSNVARDFGKMEYEITFHDGGTLSTKVDAHLRSTLETNYGEEVKQCIKAFDTWLEKTFDEATFNVSNIMKEGK